MPILENAVLKLHNAMERATDHQDESVISVKLTQREAKALVAASNVIEGLRYAFEVGIPWP
jgi:hypothetical protein